MSDTGRGCLIVFLCGLLGWALLVWLVIAIFAPLIAGVR